MEVTLFFTFGISLKDWFSSGILDRELAIYNHLYKTRGIKFNLITYGDSDDLNIEIGEGVNIFPLYENIKLSNFYLLNFFKSFLITLVFKDILKKSDIFKTNQLKGSWVGILAKFVYKKPLIVRTGYDLLKWSSHQNKGIFHKLVVKNLTRICLAYSNQYNVTSDPDLIYLQKQFKKINSNKILLRPNYINTEMFVEKQNSKLDEFLFVGRLENQKNIEFVLNEYKNFNLPKLHIVGTGSQKDFLIQQIKVNNLNIKYHGVVENSRLADFYSTIKYYLISSHFEGNPKSMLEAMSSGCIVLGSNVIGINNVIEHGKNGVLFNLELGALNKEYEKIKNNYYDLAKIKSNAVRHINDFHSLNELAHLEVSDYSNLTS